MVLTATAGVAAAGMATAAGVTSTATAKVAAASTSAEMAAPATEVTAALMKSLLDWISIEVLSGLVPDVVVPG